MAHNVSKDLEGNGIAGEVSVVFGLAGIQAMMGKLTSVALFRRHCGGCAERYPRARWLYWLLYPYSVRIYNAAQIQIRKVCGSARIVGLEFWAWL